MRDLAKEIKWHKFVLVVDCMFALYFAYLMLYPLPPRAGLPRWAPFVGAGLGLIAFTSVGLYIRRKLQIYQTWYRSMRRG